MKMSMHHHILLGFNCTLPPKKIMCALGNETVRHHKKLLDCIGVISAIKDALGAAHVQGKVSGNPPLVGKLIVVIGASKLLMVRRGREKGWSITIAFMIKQQRLQVPVVLKEFLPLK